MVACTNLAFAIAHRVGSRVQLVGSRTVHLHVVLTSNSWQCSIIVVLVLVPQLKLRSTMDPLAFKHARIR